MLTLLPLFIFWELIELPAILFLGLWLLLQLLSGVGSVGAGQDVSSIAFWAHIVGFATGAVAIFFFRRPERQQVDWWGRR